MKDRQAIKTYFGLRFFSSLFFAVVVTVSLVYQVTVVKLNPLQMVLVGTLLESTAFLFEIPTGIVADLYSRKLSVIIGVFLIGLGFIVEGSFPFFFTVLVAQIVWGIGYTFVSGAREAWIADEVGEEKAGNVFARGQQASQLGTLIGIAISIALANVEIRLPIILGGVLYSLQSLFLIFLMPETNFRPIKAAKRETLSSMKKILVEGVALIKGSKVLLFIVVSGLLFGAFSEGFDRLWTPFLIKNFSFPSFWNIKPVIWFGIISIVATILATFSTEVINRKTDTLSHKSTVKALLIINILLTIGVIVFGLVGGFAFAIIAYWFASAFREARGPVYDAWTNQNLRPEIRATVFSLCSQANAIGQIAGGPVLGFLATVTSLKMGIIGSAFVLVPTLFLYSHSLKKHKVNFEKAF